MDGMDTIWTAYCASHGVLDPQGLWEQHDMFMHIDCHANACRLMVPSLLVKT